MKHFIFIVLGLVIAAKPAHLIESKAVECDYPGDIVADPENCQNYFFCDNILEAYQFTCPNDTAWSPQINRCVSPGVVDCTYYKECQTEGQKIFDPENCASYYTCTANLDPQHSVCLTNTTFNPETDICEFNAPCTIGATTPPPVTVECSEPSTVLPDPLLCNKFWICDTNNVPDPHDCNIGLFYDPMYITCNNQELVICTDGVRPDPLPTSIPGSEIPPDTVQCTEPGELIPDPTDCSIFWKCNVENDPEFYVCPSGLNFDILTGNCNYPATAICFGVVDF